MYPKCVRVEESCFIGGQDSDEQAPLTNFEAVQAMSRALASRTSVIHFRSNIILRFNKYHSDLDSGFGLAIFLDMYCSYCQMPSWSSSSRSFFVSFS